MSLAGQWDAVNGEVYLSIGMAVYRLLERHNIQ